MKTELPALLTFTAFCRQADDRGTTWISSVKAVDLSEALSKAVAECADEWDADPRDIACVGIAEGEVTILHWEDISE